MDFVRWDVEQEKKEKIHKISLACEQEIFFERKCP